MTYHPDIHQLVKELYKLLATHYCTVVPLMLERKKHLEEILRNKKGMRDYSVTIFDLKERCFTLHNSHHNIYLKYPAVNEWMMDEMMLLNELTEANNLHFCMDTLTRSYEFLVTLTPEELNQFNVIYIRRMLEKDEQYHPYLHHMYISEYDEDDNPWLITIETKRLLDKNIPEFRKFSPATPLYTEEHSYSSHLLSLKLDEIDRKLIKKHDEDCKKKELSEWLYKSPHTVSNRYNKVNLLFKVNSINTTCLIAKIMEIV